MKKIRTLSIALAIFALSVLAACGGSGPGGELPDMSGGPAVDTNQPADGGDTGNSGGDIVANGAQDGASGTAATPVPVMVRINGMLRDAEGLGIGGATITFHSDPVTAVTDVSGLFTTMMAVGSHTFEAAITTGENFAGDIEVAATNLTNDATETIGQFSATVSSIPQAAACVGLQLVDLGQTTVTNTLSGILVGTFGQEMNPPLNEVDAQGINQTAIITGNSWMTANISLDGRLSSLWFPSVGAYNHIPYLSKVAEWVKPFQGSFAGLKRGADFYWFTDSASWNPPAISYVNGTYAPIVQIDHTGTGDCAGTTVREKIYVSWNAYASSGKYGNILLRDIAITAGTGCSSADNAAQPLELALYARFNPNASDQLFGNWIADAVATTCSSNALVWSRSDAPSYTIALEAITIAGVQQAMQSCTVAINSIEAAQQVDAAAQCFPTGVKGSIATWKLPVSNRLVITTAGCDTSGTLCTDALAYARTQTPAAIESIVKAQWDTWVNGAKSVGSNWVDYYKRWLVTIKLLADRNTGAIIASPSQEPTYYYSWPRDGVYQSLAFMLAGKSEVAEKFFRYLFNKTQNTAGLWMQTQSEDGGWTQGHSSLDGSHLGLPAPISIELDQPPTVLWGLWVYWKLKNKALPSDISVEDIEKVADYIMEKSCDTNELIAPSLDWHENPYRDIGQSIYTNAAARAGLLAAAEMIETTHASKAATYRVRATEILNAVGQRLCTSSMCHSRIKYGYFGATSLPACALSQEPVYSDEDAERLMAFAWPFHLFDLGDPRVQSYYADTAATHGNLDSFSYGDPLWVVRPLMSHLYALAALAGDELPDGAFKNDLSADVAALESRLDELITADGGYLMDQFTGDPDRVGTASRPLGWSQALGVLTALAHSNTFVPLIESSVPPPPPPPPPAGSVSTAHFTLDCSAVPDACTDAWKNTTWSNLLAKIESIYAAHSSQFSNSHYTFKVLTDAIAQMCTPLTAVGNAVNNEDVRLIINSNTQITQALGDQLSFVACHELAHVIDINGRNGLLFSPTSSDQLADWFAFVMCGYKSDSIKAFESQSDKTASCSFDPRNDSSIVGTDCTCLTCCLYSDGPCRGALAAFWSHLLLSLDDYTATRQLCGVDFDNCDFFAKAAEHHGTTYAGAVGDWRKDQLGCISCTNECTQGQTKCVSGKLYTCISDVNNCWKWDSGTICTTGICSADGLKCGNCTPNHHNACYSSDVYSYDSCNALQSLVQDCGDSGFNTTAPLTCQSGHLYQQYITKGCTNAACTQSTSSQKKQDCGTAGCSGTSCCTSHTSSACSSNDLYWYSSCNVKQDIKQSCSGAGCSSGICCVSHSSSQCYNNDIYWYSSCNVMQDMKQDCGTSTTGTNYCSGNVVYRDDIIKGCSSGACTSNTQKVLVEDCGTKKQCGGGQCTCTLVSTPWPNNTLTISSITGGKLLSWSNPSPNWVNKYVIARAQGAITPPPGLSIGSVLAPTASFTDTTGTKGQCYNYVVYAFDACNTNRNTSTMVNVCW